MFKFKYSRGSNNYEHELPAPIEISFEEEKIAKSGTGRSANNGSMTLEYLGIATKINIKWDLLPTSKDFNNLYKILTYLPDFFYFVYTNAEGELEELECYNNKWSYSVFRALNDGMYYRGLTTSFTSKDLKEISESEPTLL